MEVVFEDYSVKVIAEYDDAIEGFLREAAELLAGDAASMTKVKSGQLKGSWTYVVDDSTNTAFIGSHLENAIWNEFGTGEYAANHDGRKGGWVYQDDDGKWHHTYGKKPRHTLQHAFNADKNVIKARAKELFGGK